MAEPGYVPTPVLLVAVGGTLGALWARGTGTVSWSPGATRAMKLDRAPEDACTVKVSTAPGCVRA